MLDGTRKSLENQRVAIVCDRNAKYLFRDGGDKREH